MSSPVVSDACEQALAHLLDSGLTDLTPCVHAFTGLLLALAIRSGLADPEDAAYHALVAVRLHAGAWRASRLPARVWVLGLAVQCYRQLPQRPVAGVA